MQGRKHQFHICRVKRKRPRLHLPIRISPQGDLIAFADHSTYGSDGSVAVVDFRGRKRSLTRTFGDVSGLAWSPSGREIWFTASDNNLAPFYAVTLSGDMRMVAQMPGGLRLLDIAHDGRLLLTRDDARLGVYFLGAAESRSRELTLLNWASGPIVSSDGKRMLLSEAGAGTDGKTVLYLRLPIRPQWLAWVIQLRGQDRRICLVFAGLRAGD